MILKSNLKTQIELDFLWTFACDLGFAAVTCSFIEKVVFNLCLTLIRSPQPLRSNDTLGGAISVAVRGIKKLSQVS